MFALFSKIISFLPPRKRKWTGWLLVHVWLSTAWIFACTIVQPAQAPLSSQPTQAPATEAILESTQPAPTSSEVFQPEWIYREIPEKDDRGITFDDMVLFDGRLWLATADGVVSIDTRNYENKHYRLEEGLADDVVNTLAVCLLPETTLLAGTRSGFSVYLSDQDRWENWAEENPQSFEEVQEIDCSQQLPKMMVRYRGAGMQIFDAESNIWTTFNKAHSIFVSERITLDSQDVILAEGGGSKALITWDYFLDAEGNIDTQKFGDLLYTVDARFVISDQDQTDIDDWREPNFAIFSMNTADLDLLKDFAIMLNMNNVSSFQEPFPVFFYDRDRQELTPAGESEPPKEIVEYMQLLSKVDNFAFSNSNLFFGYLNYPEWGMHLIVPGDPYGILFSYHDKSQSERPGFRSEASAPGPDGSIWSGGSTMIQRSADDQATPSPDDATTSVGDLMFLRFSLDGWTVFSRDDVEGYSAYHWLGATALTVAEDGMVYGMVPHGELFQFDPENRRYQGLEEFDEGISSPVNTHIVVDQDGTIYYSTSQGVLAIRR